MQCSRKGRMLAIVAAAVLATACSNNRGNDPVTTRKAGNSDLHLGAGNAVREAFKQQRARTKAAAKGVLEAGDPIWVQAGKSRVIHLSSPVRRVSIGNPDMAGVVVLGPRTIMINAKPFEERRDRARTAAGRANIITNKTLTPEPHMQETNFMVWGKGDEPSVHSLFVADFIDRQVVLEVTVAEINRTAAEQHGIDFRSMANTFVSAYFMGAGAGPKVPGKATTVPPTETPLFPLSLTDSNPPLGDSPMFAFQLPQDDITGFIQALQQDGLATILAQPRLLAMSGQDAVFQVGGEIPIQIATAFSTDIEFKPFGTIVNFIPRVSEEDDVVLTVTPEVSQPDFGQPVNGVPSFRTRRASTSARLKDGQTLVIGGLLQSIRAEVVRGIPYLKDIPGLRYIFSTTTFSNEVIELMVVVTPYIVEPFTGELELPTDRGPLKYDDIRTKTEDEEAARPRIPGIFKP
jgi:Flp pilus assembly secretin CpaC